MTNLDKLKSAVAGFGSVQAEYKGINLLFDPLSTDEIQLFFGGDDGDPVYLFSDIPSVFNTPLDVIGGSTLSDIADAIELA